MCQTLFVIPEKIFGINVFGFGWLLGLWAVVAAVIFGRQFLRHGWSSETRGMLPSLVMTGLAIALLLPWLIKDGGLPIRGYGVLLVLAVSSAVGMAVYRSRRLGLDPEMIMSLAFWLFVAGVLGGRLFYVIKEWDRFQRPTIAETLGSIANVAEGGLVVYGALLAGGASLIAFVWKHHLPGLALADLVAPSVVLGMAIGRLGCFMNGCCYGGEALLPWSVTFPYGTPPYVHHVDRGELYAHGLRFEGHGQAPPIIAAVEPGSPAEEVGLKPGQKITRINGISIEYADQAQYELLTTSGEGKEISIRVADDPAPKRWTIHGPLPRSKPVHPAQLYSFVDSFFLCLFLLAYYPYRLRDGEVTALTLTLHPISRFLIEIIRVDEQAVLGTPWSIAQNISLLLLLLAAGIWIYVLCQPKGTAWPKWAGTA